MSDIVDLCIKECTNTPYINAMKQLDTFDEQLVKLSESCPTEVQLFKNHLASLMKLDTNIKQCNLVIAPDSIAQAITGFVTNDIINWGEKRERDMNAILEQVDELIASIEAENIKKNNDLKEKTNSSNATFEKLEAKRNQLKEYSDKIFDLCSRYGIKTSDVEIDDNTFSIEELNKLYDQYIEYMQKEEVGKNPIKYLRSICPDVQTQGIILLCVVVAAFTPMLDFVSILFFAYLAYQEFGQADKVKFYSVLMGIVFNVNPLTLGFKDLDKSLLLPEKLTDELIDGDERFHHFEEEMDKIDVEYEKTNPEKNLNEFLQELSTKQPDIQKKIKEYQTLFNNKKEAIANDIRSEISRANILYKRLVDSYVKFGDFKQKMKNGKPVFDKKDSTIPILEYNPGLAFNTNFVLGLTEEVIEEKVDIGFKNVIILPHPDAKLLEQFIQCLAVNAYLNVFPGKLIIHAYDPNGSATSLLKLYNSGLKDVLIIEEDLGKAIKELKEISSQNMKDLAAGSVQEFNKRCESTGETPIPYHLLFVLSQPKSVEDDEAITEYFGYSANYGVFMWVVSSTLQSKNAFRFQVPFQGVPHRLTFINDEWCKNFSSKFAIVLTQAKPAGLPYQKFVDKAIPEERIWTGNADQFIELYPGFLNGDPSSFKPYTIGNEGNVHVIGVGGTGAGKSVFLNHLIACVCRLYDPRQVELWLCDFKGVEFQAYMKYYDKEHPELNRDFMLPHIAACLCTSDADFATSLFKAFRNKADFRYDEMKAIGVKNLPGWNKYVRTHIGQDKPTGLLELHEKDLKYNKKWSEDDLWARTLFICDEFQVIFEKAEPNNLESIKADITQIAKVARACGMHIFFTSQSMKKTLSPDILQQFTLRFALRCDKDVSQEILGTTKASDIKEKNGYLIVRSVEMELEDQKRYKTPFLNDDPGSGKVTQSELFDNVKMIYDRAISQGLKLRDCITYDENVKHKPEELLQVIKEAKEGKKIPNGSLAFFIGRRMSYSTNKAPDNIIFTPKNNTHMVAIFNDYTDYYRFFMTCIDNIRNNDNYGSIVISCAIEELAYICEAEKYTKENLKRFLSPKTKFKEVYDFLYGLYEKKKAEDVKDKPLWFICMGYDKLQGYGVDADVGLRNKYNILLQQCAEYGIHIIMINTGLGTLNSVALDLFKYKVAGKCSGDESMSILGNKLAAKSYTIKTGWCFVKKDGEVTRNKLWDYKPEREIVASEVVL